MVPIEPGKKIVTLLIINVLFCRCLQYIKLTGNKKLISLGNEKIKSSYGICSCHFDPTQLRGKGEKKKLTPGEMPRLELAENVLEDDLLDQLAAPNIQERNTTNKSGQLNNMTLQTFSKKSIF